MEETIEQLRKIADGMWEHPKCAELYEIADEIERLHATTQETIARLMKLTDDERTEGRDRLLAAVRGRLIRELEKPDFIIGTIEDTNPPDDDNPPCDHCNGTGAEPLSDNVNYIPCRKCGAKRR